MCFQDNYELDLDPIIYKEKLRLIYPYLKEVCLQGGEPTVLPQAKEFMEFLIKSKPHIKFSMFTNGQLFDSYWIEKFVQHGKWANFSLDATSKETHDMIHKHGDWNKIIDNIKAPDINRKMNKSELKIYTSFSLSKITLIK